MDTFKIDQLVSACALNSNTEQYIQLRREPVKESSTDLLEVRTALKAAEISIWLHTYF